jgi:hypothetical protein
MAALSVQYDVFISHCGDDCKRDFAIFLWKELERAGIRCFFDARELRPGHNAAEKMLEAMHAARYGLVILTKGFFLRQWCMKELQTFVDRENVIPIFLSIEPGYLPDKKDAAWESFEKLPMTQEEYWRVVKSAAVSTGVRLAAVDKFWDKCIMQVRKELLKLLGRLEGGAQLSGNSLLVSIDEHVVALKELLEIPLELPAEEAEEVAGVQAAGLTSMQPGDPTELPTLGCVQEVGIVGVKGMGGVGKTTLAKKFYDDAVVRRFFEGRICWVEVNQCPSEQQICLLQEQIIWKLC